MPLHQIQTESLIEGFPKALQDLLVKRVFVLVRPGQVLVMDMWDCRIDPRAGAIARECCGLLWRLVMAAAC